MGAPIRSAHPSAGQGSSLRGSPPKMTWQSEQTRSPWNGPSGRRSLQSATSTIPMKHMPLRHWRTREHQCGWRFGRSGRSRRTLRCLRAGPSPRRQQRQPLGQTRKRGRAARVNRCRRHMPTCFGIGERRNANSQRSICDLLDCHGTANLPHRTRIRTPDFGVSIWGVIWEVIWGVIWGVMSEHVQ